MRGQEPCEGKEITVNRPPSRHMDVPQGGYVSDTNPCASMSRLSDKLKEKIFTRFERGMARGSGEGLGLFIVRTLVKRYGGDIWVEDRVPDRPERGTAFRFTLKKA